MTTLQTGTKVLIEATVEAKIEHNLYTGKTKTGKTVWFEPSDLTVCETAEPIDLQNFAIDITDPVNAELLPGYQSWYISKFGNTYRFNKYGIIEFWGVFNGVVYNNCDNHYKVSVHTLPELQKQHPGVFGKLVDLTCMGCGKSFKGEEPKMCCSGRECGCMGQPIDPVICSEECYYKLPHMKSKATPTPSFKAGQEVEAALVNDLGWKPVIYCCENPAPYCGDEKYIVKTPTGLRFAFAVRPIPAQPTVESELREILWTGAGHASMCWEPRPSGVFDEKEANVAAKNMYDQVMAWHQKHSGRVEVSVPSDDEIEKDGKERGLRDNELQLWWEGAVWMRNFMTRKEAK